MTIGKLPPQASVDPRCMEILTIHSSLVWRKAEEIARRSRYADCIDYGFVREASMLHDYGIIGVDAPGIYCRGAAPYMQHGILGAAHLRAVDPKRYARHARVCETHIGAGLTAADIRSGNLPLPEADYLPVTLEEKLIAYADNFFSKNPECLCAEKSFEHIAQSASKHGSGTLERLYALRDMWEPADS